MQTKTNINKFLSFYMYLQSSPLPQPSSSSADQVSVNQSVSDRPGTSTQSCVQMETGNRSTGTGTHPHMDTGNEAVTAVNQSTEAGAQSQIPDCDPVDYAVVNRCLQEPVLCRDASETKMPSLLQEVHAAADPQDSVEALSVVLHVLMLETGYVNKSQVSKVHILTSTYILSFHLKVRLTW